VDELTLDSEGRCVILEFPAFVLFGVYSPAQRDETRTEFRQAFLDVLDVRLRNLVAIGKQVVLTGDLNIIRSEIDTAGLKERLRKENMTVEDFFSMPARRLFNHLVYGGTIYGDRDKGRERPILHDICREFHQSRLGMYTCWETKKNARPGNFGSRIDYVLCSAGIRSWFVEANIQEGLLGSDHCPVYATLGDTVRLRSGAQVSVLDVMNPGDMFRSGERVRKWSTKDVLPLSAKRIPEFEKRRNIRDMFSRSTSVSSSTPVTATAIALEDSEIPNVVEVRLPKPEEAPANEMLSEADTPSAVEMSPINEPTKKRQGHSSPAASKAAKRSKPSLAKEPSAKASTGGTQSSLITGFFKPKTPKPGPAPTAAVDDDEQLCDASPLPTQGSPAKAVPQMLSPRKENGKDVASLGEADKFLLPAAVPSDAGAAEERFIDPIEAKESWSKLLSKRRPPRCEGHNEPCISLLTKKAGINCGMFRSSHFDS
jgi:AP endonuclease 2